VNENEKKAFRHSPQIWELMWKEIGERTGTRWKVNATDDISEWFANMKRKTEETSQGDWDRSLRPITFTVTRQ
jgi:hypothetical protein